MRQATPVVISGGGPCGLMTALLLTRAGVASVVLERKTGLSTHPKAMGVSRRTAEIYRQIGLLDRINDGSLSVDGHWLGLWAKSLVGEELGRVPLAELHSIHTPCVAMHCPQTWTEQVLFEALQKETLAELRFDAEVISIEPKGEVVGVTLRSGEILETPWLVAADGAGSLVRHQLNIGAVGPGDMGHFINVMFRAAYGKYLKDRPAILYHTLSEEGFENFVAVNGDDIWLMHHFLQPGETVDDYTKEQFAEIIRRASGLPEERVEVLSLSPWVMSPKVAERIREGRVLLVGDAAARLSPTGGLGLNTGMQSVHNLVWKLAAVVRGQAGEALLDTYHSERHGTAVSTMQHTNSNAEEIFAVVTAGLQGEWDRVRSLVGQSRRGGTGLGQDLGLRYGEGAFIPDGTTEPAEADPVNDYIPSARPGGRAPHLWADNKGHSLLEFFGKGFCLLIGKDGDAWRQAGGVALVQNGREFSAHDFETIYGIQTTGAVLVRPDGYVGARFFEGPPSPPETLKQALDLILRR